MRQITILATIRDRRESLVPTHPAANAVDCALQIILPRRCAAVEWAQTQWSFQPTLETVEGVFMWIPGGGVGHQLTPSVNPLDAFLHLGSPCAEERTRTVRYGRVGMLAQLAHNAASPREL